MQKTTAQDDVPANVGYFASLRRDQPAYPREFFCVRFKRIEMAPCREYDLNSGGVQFIDRAKILRADREVRAQQRSIEIDRREFE